MGNVEEALEKAENLYDKVTDEMEQGRSQHRVEAALQNGKQAAPKETRSASDLESQAEVENVVEQIATAPNNYRENGEEECARMDSTPSSAVCEKADVPTAAENSADEPKVSAPTREETPAKVPNADLAAAAEGSASP